MFRAEGVAVKSADKKPRRSAARAVLFLAVAIVAALGTGLLLTRYMDARTAAVRVPTDKVVVAVVDIPLASPIKPEWLAIVDWPRASRPENAFADPQQAVGKVAAVAIVKGEPILGPKLASAVSRGGLATLIPRGMRAVAVRVDDVVGVAGFLHPGDAVDVLVTMRPSDSAPFASRIILQNARLLAVGKDLEHRAKEAEKSAPATVATIMVSPEEAERLALASTQGKLLLALRGLGDAEFAETRGIVPPTLLATVLPEAPTTVAEGQPRARPARRTPPAAPPVAIPGTKEKQVVEILRGDMFEKRDFDRQERGQ